MKYLFSPSLMCMNLINLNEQISVLNSKADFLHVDIMDGHFVKNITLSPFFIEQIKSYVNIPIDAHLMVENPGDYIEICEKSGASFITIHAETINREAFRIIDRIKSHGLMVGIALNPATPISEIKHYINKIDKITIMTVDPGFAGQPFIPEVLEKIRDLKRLKDDNNYNYLIEADGSCNKNTFQVLKDAGCEVFVLGSSGFFNLSDDLGKAWEIMIGNFNG